ncbi:MAG: pentapeptide repeat-containing protein [Oscillatoriales cyanobacterium]|nr:MAG: pentapeptide repeat-containing protein [Oscillatoriales cyanobacterium]
MSKPKRHNFANAKLVGLSFDRQNLAGADFSDAYINNCSFKQANLSGANFQRARIGHTQNTTRRKLISASVTAGTTLLVLLIARFNNSAFATASMLSVMLVIIAQLYKYTPALAWLWAATLPATFYLSVAGLYRAYRNFSLGLTPIALAYVIVVFMFASVSIVFSMKLVEGIQSTGASFLEANLTHANFSEARIEKTSFLRAKLNHVKWFNSILSSCTFSAGSAPVEAYQAVPKLREIPPEKPDIRIT